MRLTCSQKDLASALGITNHAIGVSNTLPILNNVFLKADGNQLFFAATNLEVAIQYSIAADVQEAGEITIPSKLFGGYVNYLSGDSVEMTAEEGGALLIKTPDSKSSIKGLPANEFPSIPTIEKEASVVLSSRDLARAINQVAFAAALNTTRPILTGVYFYLEEDRLKMVATDSYRLAEKTVATKSVTGAVNCIVPVKTLLELGGILGGIKDEVEVEVVISKNQIGFNFEKIQITSRLIEGQFPNYRQVIPKEHKTRVTLRISDLSLVLKRINLFARENNNKVLIRVADGRVVVTTDSTEYGVGEVELQTHIEGESAEIALNSQFMLDVLGGLYSEDVVVDLGEKTQPAIFRPKGREDYTHIIMPLKL
jgi:DNA polymerase-3 subunit beta